MTLDKELATTLFVKRERDPIFVSQPHFSLLSAKLGLREYVYTIRYMTVNYVSWGKGVLA